jgi:hypothetical protein
MMSLQLRSCDLRLRSLESLLKLLLAGFDLISLQDRHKANVPKAQLGFIEYLVRPMYEAWVRNLRCQF